MSVLYLIWLQLFNKSNTTNTMMETPPAIISYIPMCNNCVVVDKTEKVNTQNNPLLNVQVYVKGNLVKEFEAVSGRSYTQHLDRHVGGNAAPSPTGKYKIYPETVGYHKETGGVFLPYEPLFETNREFLGYHVDPSWGKDNGEDGTVGCIAFSNLNDYSNFVTLIETYNITEQYIDY